MTRKTNTTTKAIGETTTSNIANITPNYEEIDQYVHDMGWTEWDIEHVAEHGLGAADYEAIEEGRVNFSIDDLERWAREEVRIRGLTRVRRAWWTWDDGIGTFEDYEGDIAGAVYRDGELDTTSDGCGVMIRGITRDDVPWTTPSADDLTAE
jgi:hypothetical protein